mmetsp:Transcript_97715/g.232652  ORF Transcript_97715/g.232652 Transcript_97715/m.232652 type:complete len:221 (-) Transcript_97715:895-1557(-)
MQFQLRSSCAMLLLLNSSTTHTMVVSSSQEEWVPSPVSASDSWRMDTWLRRALHKGTCHFTPMGKPDKLRICRPSSRGQEMSCIRPAKGSSCTRPTQPARLSFSNSQTFRASAGLACKCLKRCRKARSEIPALPSRSNSRKGEPISSISQMAKRSRSDRPCALALMQSEWPVTKGSVDGKSPSRLHALKYCFVDKDWTTCPESQGRWNFPFSKRAVSGTS